MKRAGEWFFLVVLLAGAVVCVGWNALASRWRKPGQKTEVGDQWDEYDEEVRAMGKRMQEYQDSQPQSLWWWVIAIGVFVAVVALIGSVVVIWR